MTLLQLPKVIDAVNDLGIQVQILKARVESLEQQIQLAKTVKEITTTVKEKKK